MNELTELEQLLREATQTVEDELKLEDEGWILLGASTGEVVSAASRKANLLLSRLYYTKDPLARQAIRLWTDYTFGSGMTWQVEEESTQKALKGFWDAKANQSVLSARGQRKSSDKLLVDGEIFFAVFLGSKGEAKIRRIDPLEITEIITNPDDVEDVRFYKREWTDSQSKAHVTIYRSFNNPKGEGVKDSLGADVKHNDDAFVYHLTYNTIGQRGNPLLLPALDWIKQYRRFLASRVAVMLALARFAWKAKTKGGQTAVDSIKATYQDKEVAAGSVIVENFGSDMQPIKTDSGASNAYQDGRMLKLQVAAAVGIPEQYFGDISIGNLATAKTVELPMMKMFQSYQAVWSDAFKDIDELVLEHNGVSEDKWYVDRDFPAIAPADVAQIAESLALILQNLPQLGDSPDVLQVALMALGINDPAEVLDALAKETKGNTDARLVRALREFRVEQERKGGDHEGERDALPKVRG